ATTSLLPRSTRSCPLWPRGPSRSCSRSSSLRTRPSPSELPALAHLEEELAARLPGLEVALGAGGLLSRRRLPLPQLKDLGAALPRPHDGGHRPGAQLRR